MTKKEAEVIAADEQTTAIVNWEEKLGKYAEAVTAEESVQGTWMSVKAGRLSIDKTPVAGNVLDCVVIAYAHENAYYEGKFDPNNPKPPVCYAINPEEENLMPHEKAEDAQAEGCADCPKNQWGSGEGGKGKACKNIRRLALLPLDAAQDPTKTATADVVYLKLPVMSVRNWAKYVNDCAAETKRPPFAVVTQIGTEPDTKAQFKVTFKLGFKVTDPAVLEQLVARHEREMKAIDFPYQAAQAAAPVAENKKF